MHLCSGKFGPKAKNICIVSRAKMFIQPTNQPCIKGGWFFREDSTLPDAMTLPTERNLAEGVALRTWNSGVKNQRAVLTFEAQRMEIFAKSSQSWRRAFSSLWQYCLPTGAALCCMLLLIILSAVDLLVLSQREWNSNHTLLAHRACEAIRVVQRPRHLHYPSLNHKTTLLAVAQLLPVIRFTDNLIIVEGVVGACDHVPTLAALLLCLPL